MLIGASSATARQRPGAVTFARLTPYLRGIIYGLRMFGENYRAAQTRVCCIETNHNRRPSSRDTISVTTLSGNCVFPRRTSIEGRRSVILPYGHVSDVAVCSSLPIPMLLLLGAESRDVSGQCDVIPASRTDTEALRCLALAKTTQPRPDTERT